MWWADLGWLPDAHPATLLFCLFNKMGRANRMEKVVAWDKDRENAYQLLSWAKQTERGKLVYLLPPSFLTLLPTSTLAEQGDREGGRGQPKQQLSAALSSSQFPWSCMGSLLFCSSFRNLLAWHWCWREQFPSSPHQGCHADSTASISTETPSVLRTRLKIWTV